MYKMDKAVYENHLTNCITSTCKKSNPERVELINKREAKCAKQVDLDDRMEILQTSEGYITVKDHKDDFNAKPTFRLINPSKTDIGCVSKQLLDEIKSSCVPLA